MHLRVVKDKFSLCNEKLNLSKVYVADDQYICNRSTDTCYEI